MIVRSGSTPASSWAPPRETRKPVITSSKISSAPFSSASSRSPSRNPQAGGTRPMFAGQGSARIAANGSAATASRTASRSFQGAIRVAATADSGTPGLAGIPWVASPEPASASSPSTWP